MTRVKVDKNKYFGKGFSGFPKNILRHRFLHASFVISKQQYFLLKAVSILAFSEKKRLKKNELGDVSFILSSCGQHVMVELKGKLNLKMLITIQ